MSTVASNYTEIFAAHHCITSKRMPKSSKRKRLCRSMRAIQKRQERKANVLLEELALFEELSLGITNPKGRTRGFEENKLLLLATLAELKRRINNTDGSKKAISQLCWTDVECQVAEDFHVRREYITDLRKVFLEDVDSEDERTVSILVWDNGLRLDCCQCLRRLTLEK